MVPDDGDDGMNGGLVPLLLLSATIGLMLAMVGMPGKGIGLAAFAGATVPGFALSTGLAPDTIFAGLWLSMIATAITVYLPVAHRSIAAIPLCLNGGYWLGACAALSQGPFALSIALLPALIALPAASFTWQKFDIVIKVVASWMIAIASLSLFVSLVPTPGYKADHME